MIKQSASTLAAHLSGASLHARRLATTHSASGSEGDGMGDFIARAAWGRADGLYFASTTVGDTPCRASGFATLDACLHELARLAAEALRHPAQHTELVALPSDDTLPGTL